jgi:hypothetical protein
VSQNKAAGILSRWSRWVRKEHCNQRSAKTHIGGIGIGKICETQWVQTSLDQVVTGCCSVSGSHVTRRKFLGLQQGKMQEEVVVGCAVSGCHSSGSCCAVNVRVSETFDSKTQISLRCQAEFQTLNKHVWQDTLSPAAHSMWLTFFCLFEHVHDRFEAVPLSCLDV